MKNGHLLNQCLPEHRDLFYKVDTIVSVEILPSTIRTQKEQLDYFARGVSKTKNSKHLISEEHPLSRAVDAGPS